jgi:hypothetical protein
MNNELQHHHPQSMAIIGDSTSFPNVNQLPHCDHTWGVSDGGVVSPPNGKSHIMALSAAGGEIATLGAVAKDDDGNFISAVVQLRGAQIISFNALHFGSGGNGDSSSPRVRCYRRAWGNAVQRPPLGAANRPQSGGRSRAGAPWGA